MKKVLFIHDGPRWKDAQGKQYGTAADADMYARYQYLCNKVEFVMRIFKVADPGTLLNVNDIGLYINPIVPFNRPGLLRNYFSSKKEIQKQVESADIVVVRLPSTIGSVALAHAKKISKPYIVEVVACPWDALTNHSRLGQLYAPLSKNKLTRLVSDAPFVVYVTKYFLQKRYPTKYQSINISNVVLRNFPAQNSKENYYVNFDSKKTIIITTIGVVNLAYKGQQYVLRAMTTLLKEGYNVFYNIVGGGDNTRLINIATELDIINKVNFTGKLTHNEVFKVLENTDLYIQPSETEGLPRALIEAMSRGCACIGSDAGGIPELLDQSAIFKSKNVEDLTQKIRNILHKETLKEHSDMNFEHAKDYAFEILEAKRQAFYDKFLNSINGK